MGSVRGRSKMEQSGINCSSLKQACTRPPFLSPPLLMYRVDWRKLYDHKLWVTGRTVRSTCTWSTWQKKDMVTLQHVRGGNLGWFLCYRCVPVQVHIVQVCTCTGVPQMCYRWQMRCATHVLHSMCYTWKFVYLLHSLFVAWILSWDKREKTWKGFLLLFLMMIILMRAPGHFGDVGAA